jgi:hypothetical protein
MRASKARAGRRTGKVCHRRWNAYGKPQIASPSNTRGGSRVPESGPLGSVRSFAELSLAFVDSLSRRRGGILNPGRAVAIGCPSVGSSSSEITLPLSRTLRCSHKSARAAFGVRPRLHERVRDQCAALHARSPPQSAGARASHPGAERRLA